ncbi:MAG TPA: type II toxin-antitoxin system ParD family antitoxin [Allosphingosinicella sp.]|jgi:antitoxin ParD1/3/4
MAKIQQNPRMTTVNISIPEELKNFVDSQVATGQYADVSDYMRAVIRERQEAVDRLRALIDEGDASPDSPYTIDEIIAQARERHLSRAG